MSYEVIGLALHLLTEPKRPYWLIIYGLFVSTVLWKLLALSVSLKKTLLVFRFPFLLVHLAQMIGFGDCYFLVAYK